MSATTLHSATKAHNRNDQTTVADHTSVRVWLLLCCLGIAWMVAIGGWTRLTDSGLSMTDWRPVTGVVPPLTAEAWQQEFDAYRSSPQYQLLNKGMSLDEFRRIFWPEFLHRLSGRAVGLLFFLPLIYFTLRRNIPKRAAVFCYVAAAGGCAQGLIGWWMVKSGLSDSPYVSHYRLAFHLSMAFFLFSMLYVARLRITDVVDRKRATTTERRGWICILVLTSIQIILGAFVAGKDAGHAFSDFPLMAGVLIPPGTMPLLPHMHEALADPITLHVLHRLSGYTLWMGALAIALLLSVRGCSYVARFRMIAIIITLQVIFGAWTVLSGIDIIAASVHQLFALVLFAFLVKTGYILYNHNN